MRRQPSLGQARRPQQGELGLQACRIGEPDLTQGSDTKARHCANQPADRLCCLFALAKTSAAQCEDTIGAPVAPQKADDDGTTIEKNRKIDEIAAPASEPEQGRRLAGFLRRWREGWFCKRLDRAARGIKPPGVQHSPRTRDGILQAAPSTT